MEKVAFILGGRYVYWSSLILTLAAAVAVCVFLFFYFRKSETVSGCIVLPLAMILSLFCARFVHWYCYDERYESMMAALTDFASGGFALVGVFVGCGVAAVLTRILFLHRNLPLVLDCMSLAGAAGIAVGRLASFFNSSDRGQMVESIRTMPWVYPVINSVSGATEYRIATFLLQAMMSGVLFLLLAAFFLRRKPRRDGDTTLLFLLSYGASQILLDSTRYDSIYFRSNGFVSIVQVCSIAVVVITILIFSVRLVKNRGFHNWYVGLWGSLLALIGGAGYMEYHIQRHGDDALFAYSVMGLCLIFVVLIALLIRALAEKQKRPSRKGRFQQ